MLSLDHVVAAFRAAWQFFSGSRGASGEVMARVLEDNFDGIVVIDEDGRIIAASRVACMLLIGPQGGALTGRVAAEVLPAVINEAVQRAFADGRRAVPSPMAPAQIGDPRRGGYLVQFVVTLSEVTVPSGPLSRRVVNLTFWDETDRRRREDELVFLGTHDPLTGALVRSELVKIVNAALAGERHRHAGLTMVLVDLRRFKSINETLGHSHGDMVLKQVMSRLRGAGIETVARLGGDTFALIRHGRMSDEETQRFCGALIERLTLPYSLGAHRVVVGADIGLTHTEISGFDPEVLLSHADVALEAAKRLPGNNFVRFTPEMDRQLKARQEIETALRSALDTGQMALTYQPQCSLETGQVVGVEALLRFTHPELGVVAPELFIPLAEESGEIARIGRWMLRTACEEVARWPVQVRLAVNVSPVQFQFTDLVAEVKEALSQSGLPPHRLDIEITEGLLVSKSGEIVETLRTLRDLGVGIALDDFGTGYSSLGYLGRLPVDKIKIDQSFVSSLPADGEASAIIRAVMTLSETLNKAVIAEGVETADQVWMLRMMGCRVGQGYYFGRARTAAEMLEWFEDQPAAVRRTAR